MGVTVENCIHTVFRQKTATLPQTRGGIGEMFSTAMQSGNNQIVFGTDRFYFADQAEHIQSANPGGVFVRCTELIFCDIEKGDLQTVVFDMERLCRLLQIHACSDGTDVQIAECIKSIFDAFGIIVAGMIVGEQDGIDIQSCCKGRTLRFAAVVRPGFVDRSSADRCGTFPLEDTEVRIVKERFDRGCEFRGTLCDRIRVFFPRTEVPGNRCAESFSVCITPFD